jgi:glycosyltransferase involved in cell wall biosynthesis
MKIAIINTMQPFVYGGAEILADSLKDKLIEYGYEAQVIRIPFSWDPVDNIVDSMMAARLTQLINTDMMIGLKFPAYLIPHDNKKLWLLHQFRQAYDLDGTEFSLFSSDENSQKIKRTIIEADNCYLKPLEGRIFTNSHIVCERLMKYNGIKSEVLYPPLMDSKLFFFDEIGDYIFYPSRVNQTKRQYLAVEAMLYVKTGVKLVLAGVGDSPDDEKQIFEMIEKYGLNNKVTYYNRFISQQEKADFFSKCLGGIYIPYDEDSYGYVTLECLNKEKPVISCTDAGGTSIVVKDGYTGYMTEPSPKAIAEAMDKLYKNNEKAHKMGKNGLTHIDKIGISWETVIKMLLE